MNNLLCCILFYITALCLVNADCTTYPGIINATFNKDDKCGDVTFRCDKGFTMEQGMTCIGGEWKYQEPFCKPLELKCSYTFTNNTYVRVDSISNDLNLNQTECNKRCDVKSECTTAFVNKRGTCYLYPAQLISRSEPTDLDQCMAQCTQMKKCLLLSHWEEYNECFMYNVANIETNEYYGDTVAEKCL